MKLKSFNVFVLLVSIFYENALIARDSCRIDLCSVKYREIDEQGNGVVNLAYFRILRGSSEIWSISSPYFHGHERYDATDWKLDTHPNVIKMAKKLHKDKVCYFTDVERIEYEY